MEHGEKLLGGEHRIGRSEAATKFFVVTAVLEGGAGLTLLLAPALVINLLFVPSEVQTAAAIGRLAGAALVSLGAACWWARHDAGSGAAKGLVGGLLIYNAAVIALVLSGNLGPFGPLQWAAVVVHGAMDMWCVWSLRVGGERTRLASNRTHGLW